MKRKLVILALALGLFAATASFSVIPAAAGSCSSSYTNLSATSTPYGVQYSAITVYANGYYPTCSYEYRLHDFSNSGNIDVAGIQLRWWICGTGYGYGFNAYNVPDATIGPGGWHYYGSCGPQADNGGNRQAKAGTGYFVNPYVSI